MAVKHSSVFPSPPTSIKDEATRDYLMGLYRSLVYNDVDETLDTSHDAVTLAASADTLLGLSTQQLSLDTKAANLHFIGPASGAATAPTFRSLVDADLGTTLGPTFDHLHITNGATFGDQPRTSPSLYRRYYHIPLGTSNPGASGATWVDGGANTTGGWQLNAVGDTIRGGTDIHSDWDGASDLKVEVRFMINAAGALAGDTVDLRLVCRYKGVGDTAVKTQTVEVPTTVGAAAQYTAFKADFTLDWDAAGNIIEAGDHLSFYLNLETDTSEVDDVTITGMSFSYLTTHIGIEDGDE